MTQYEAISKRRSVRKYQMKAIDPKIMAQINAFIQTVSPLHPQASYRVAVVENYNNARSAVVGRFTVQAPYYLVLTAKEHPYAAVNAGYVMEQIVLYLTTKGMGTCYLGEARIRQDTDSYGALIIVAFGRPAAPVSAKGKRKSIAAMTFFHEENSQSVRRVLEAARLAPSAMNLQPWRFEVYAGGIHLFMKRSLPVETKRLRELELLDMGIVMCHMALAAEELWLDWRLAPAEPAPVPDRKNCSYVATLFLAGKEF